MAIVTAKCAYELWTGHVVFEFMHMGMCGRPMAASHAGGVAGGIGAYIICSVLTHMDINGMVGRGAGSKNSGSSSMGCYH